MAGRFAKVAVTSFFPMIALSGVPAQSASGYVSLLRFGVLIVIIEAGCLVPTRDLSELRSSHIHLILSCTRHHSSFTYGSALSI